MGLRSWKNMITEFMERFDEAVIQGIMVRENTVLVKQQADTGGGLWECGENRNSLIQRRSDWK